MMHVDGVTVVVQGVHARPGGAAGQVALPINGAYTQTLALNSNSKDIPFSSCSSQLECHPTVSSGRGGGLVPSRICLLLPLPLLGAPPTPFSPWFGRQFDPNPGLRWE